jgi:hypothetical protein
VPRLGLLCTIVVSLFMGAASWEGVTERVALCTADQNLCEWLRFALPFSLKGPGRRARHGDGHGRDRRPRRGPDAWPPAAVVAPSGRPAAVTALAAAAAAEAAWREDTLAGLRLADTPGRAAGIWPGRHPLQPLRAPELRIEARVGSHPIPRSRPMTRKRWRRAGTGPGAAASRRRPSCSTRDSDGLG